MRNLKDPAVLQVLIAEAEEAGHFPLAMELREELKTVTEHRPAESDRLPDPEEVIPGWRAYVLKAQVRTRRRRVA